MSHARIHPKTVTIITIILFSLCILGITNRIWKTHKHKHTHTHEYIIQGKYNNRKDPKPKHIHNVWNLKCGKVVCFSHSENAAFWENAFFVILNKRRAQWIRIHHSSSHFWRSVLSLSYFYVRKALLCCIRNKRELTYPIVFIIDRMCMCGRVSWLLFVLFLLFFCLSVAFENNEILDYLIPK